MGAEQIGAAASFRGETQVAVDAVEQALPITRSRAGADEITYKAARDLVTATDVAIEDAVRKLIGEALGDAVVGEEKGGVESSSYWLVDPICGTRNFASGLPLYSVNLAHVEDGEIIVGVIGDPSTGEILVAERGGGAWALGADACRRLTVSDETQTLVIEDSHANPDPARRERAAAAVANAVRAFRWDIRAFSTSLALGYVANARVAAYVLFWTSAVHVAAGSLVASEAGAIVSDVDGRPWQLESDSIVASATESLHRDVLDLARS
jgi:myo-inositol-1(or 4)-monophosphatase